MKIELETDPATLTLITMMMDKVAREQFYGNIGFIPPPVTLELERISAIFKSKIEEEK